MWPWRVNITTQNLLRLLLLLMLMMRIVLATVCCSFGSWGLVIKLIFCSDFEQKVWSRFEVEVQARFWSWSLVSILLLIFADVWLRFWVNAKSRFWNWNLIKISLRTCHMNSTLGSVVPLAMFLQWDSFLLSYIIFWAEIGHGKVKSGFCARTSPLLCRVHYQKTKPNWACLYKRWYHPFSEIEPNLIFWACQ